MRRAYSRRCCVVGVLDDGEIHVCPSTPHPAWTARMQYTVTSTLGRSDRLTQVCVTTGSEMYSNREQACVSHAMLQLLGLALHAL